MPQPTDLFGYFGNLTNDASLRALAGSPGYNRNGRAVTVRKGRFHACDARCTGATGHECECACLGRNHGIYA